MKEFVTRQGGKINLLFSKEISEKNVKISNFLIAKGVSDAIRTSLGPHGMDKIIISEKEILITNDGATIMKNAKFEHPVAKLLSSVSESQDSEVGDGTTSVIILSGSLLGASLNLIRRGITGNKLSSCLGCFLDETKKILLKIAIPIDLKNSNALYNAACTSLESKVVSSHCHILAPIAVKSILSILDRKHSFNVDLKRIKIIKKMGGTVEQTELINGIAIDYPVIKSYGGPNKMINARVALIQFSISSPSTDTENSLVIENYTHMDKLLKEEKQFIISLCRKIKSTSCNVVLIQKSILKDSICDFAIQILAQMKIMLIRDIDREDFTFIADALGCIPVNDIETFSNDKLGIVKLVEEKNYNAQKIVVFKNICHRKTKYATILIRSSNKHLLEETERSLHDALCVMRSIIRRRFLITGGGAMEIEVSLSLKQFGKTLTGINSYCFNAFAHSLEIIPYTLCENAGLEPIEIISRMKKYHLDGKKTIGINTRKGILANMVKENIISPLLVATSIFNMSVEFTIQLLKIDSIIEI